MTLQNLSSFDFVETYLPVFQHSYVSICISRHLWFRSPPLCHPTLNFSGHQAMFVTQIGRQINAIEIRYRQYRCRYVGMSILQERIKMDTGVAMEKQNFKLCVFFLNFFHYSQSTFIFPLVPLVITHNFSLRSVSFLL